MDVPYGESVKMPRGGMRGMVVADDQSAAEWGAEILRKGGNAVDAAVATSFAMAVTRPHYAALGGGGFMVYCPAPKQGRAQDCTALNFRELAPEGASRDMFVKEGKADTKLSRNGALASGVPGNVSGWLFALERFGKKNRKELISRPISMARDGVRMSTHTERAALDRWDAMNPEAKRIFGCGNADRPCEVGSLLKQPELAKVLDEITAQGTKGFYSGWVARKLSKGVRDAGGLITEKDLLGFRTEQGAPLKGTYHGQEVLTMPPPSSGGVALLQLLGYMDRARKAGLLKDGLGSTGALHAEAHAMALAFADRAEHLGDPAFYSVPLAGLLDPAYLDGRWTTFRKSSSSLPEKAGEARPEPQHTTHLSVIDGEGGAVAMTLTVNDNFGSGFVPPGTGIVMNNQMDDFSVQPGVPNLFGLVGGEANSIHAGKRPLSSMTPTILRDPGTGRIRLVVGAAGGPRIITATFQTIANRFEYGMSIMDAVSAPRIHQQWRPKQVRMERHGFPLEVRDRLKELGYAVEEYEKLGTVHALERMDNGRVSGAPDPRGEGFAAAE